MTFSDSNAKVTEGAAPAPPRPNVVIIYADDLGYGDLSCFGSQDVQTPHLDQLAADGIRLTSWYSNSPVCSPSRASLLTGRYPARAGVEEILGGHSNTYGMPAQTTLASRLRATGYRTGIFGKWHLGAGQGDRPEDRGFDEHFGFLAGCVDYYSHIFYWAPDRNPVHDLRRNGREVYENGRYLTDAIADEAVAFLERTSDQPFFCYVPFNAPHYPMHAPRHYVDRFPDLPDDRRIMAAMIAAMDDGVGRVLACLDRLGLAEDTIVFFSSDNGPSAESRNWLDGEEISYTGGSTGGLRGHKGSLFEGGIRVPSIITWPAGLPRGTTVDQPTLMMDLVPTLLEATGVSGGSQPDEMDGTSVLDALRGSQTPGVRDICWQYETQAAVRRQHWKLVRNPSDRLGEDPQAGEQLFDLSADHQETTDLAASHPELVESLGQSLDAWLAEMSTVRQGSRWRRAAAR